MTDFARLLGPDQGDPAQTLHLVTQAGFDAFLAGLGEAGRSAVASAGFRGRAETACFLPGTNGRDWGIAVGLGDAPPGRWSLAAAAQLAPEGSYRLSAPVPAAALHGWLMAQHRFTRYRRPDDLRGPRRLLLADPAAIAPALGAADAEARLRDLIDTPADHMGPAELEAEVRALAEAVDARVSVTVGEALLEQGFP
ncbi:MAG: leucyl aminopeptidase family protein, partial [Sphingomonadaceae bacterium]